MWLSFSLFILILFSLLGLAALLGLSRRTSWLPALLSAVASLMILIAGVEGSGSWRAGAPVGTSILASLSSISLGVDGLSAFFLIILGLIGLCSSIYSLSSFKHGATTYRAAYPLFILSMFLVLIVRSLLWFVIFWELMTLFSQFLIANGREGSRGAALRYFCTTKGAADFMLLSVVVIIWKLSGSPAYSAISSVLPAYMSSHRLTFVLISAGMLTGLGIKATLVPFHFWVPDAYTSAPGEAAALMSGAMEKLPVYMMFRYLLTFSPLSAPLGLAVAVAGTLTLFFGTMFALRQTDSKRLLAYHSVGQMGYIVMALGAGLYLLSRGYTLLGSLALMASLFHSLNHATFKSLLFLTASSVYRRTGLRNLNRLGGLWKVMPLTAVSALIGSLAIAGVPPLNGFVSKWMIYVSTMPSSTVVSLFGALALFISSVTAASFVKYFTTVFVRPPAGELNVSGEVPPWMTVPQWILAALCVFLGVYPYLPLRAISRALGVVGVKAPALSSFPGVVVPRGLGNVAPLTFFVFMVVLTSILLLLVRPVMRLPGWTTGTRVLRETAMRLPAGSYYASFEEDFGEVYGFGAAIRRLGLWIVRCVGGVARAAERCSADMNGMLIGAFVGLLIFVVVLGRGVP
ncbi:MAG: hydantoin racemase [Thermococci archaeon]|nr:hydantoin racemase [Thermococci archaeon]